MTTERLTWGDLAAIVDGAPESSPLHRALAGEGWAHDWHLEMARSALYMLSVLAWQQSGDGTKEGTQPDPYRFPWEPQPDGGQQIDAITVEEAVERLGLPEKYITLANAR